MPQDRDSAAKTPMTLWRDGRIKKHGPVSVADYEQQVALRLQKIAQRHALDLLVDDQSAHPHDAVGTFRLIEDEASPELYLMVRPAQGIGSNTRVMQQAHQMFGLLLHQSARCRVTPLPDAEGFGMTFHDKNDLARAMNMLLPRSEHMPSMHEGCVR